MYMYMYMYIYIYIYEELIRLAETRLAEHSLDYIKIVVIMV